MTSASRTSCNRARRRPALAALVAAAAIVGTTLFGGAAAFAARSGPANALPSKPAPPTTTAAPAPTTAPANTVTNSWALAPTGSDPTQPGSRASFSYSLQPGAKIDDSATIWNYSSVQLTFHVYATDAFNTPTGDFTLLTGDKKAKDVGSWVSVAQSYVTVPASTSLELPITLTVPADAKPGDHAAGLIATSQTEGTGPDGKKILLDRRAGSRIYLRVNGPVNPGLSVEDLSTKYNPSFNPLNGSLDVRYTVRNTGNIRLSARQLLSVSDVFGAVAKRKPKDIPELLPGNAITLTSHFKDVAATVRVSTAVHLLPYEGKTTTVQTPPATLARSSTTVSAHAWAIPWTLVAVLVVLGGVITYLRRRRRRNNPPVGPDGAVGGGGLSPDGSAPAPRTPVGVQLARLRRPGGPVTT